MPGNYLVQIMVCHLWLLKCFFHELWHEYHSFVLNRVGVFRVVFESKGVQDFFAKRCPIFSPGAPTWDKFLKFCRCRLRRLWRCRGISKSCVKQSDLVKTIVCSGLKSWLRSCFDLVLAVGSCLGLSKRYMIAIRSTEIGIATPVKKLPVLER